MIISRTPLRMSFVGGGSDLRSYYKHQPGAVLSTTINKYVHITANRRFTDNMRITYSQVEEVDAVDKIKHQLMREAMKISGHNKGIDLAYISDLLAAHEGSGLGSSSAIAVGTLNALHALDGKHVPARILAEQACNIEIERLGHPIGKQDQFATAFGGLNLIQFNSDETVTVDKVIMKKNIRDELQNNLLAFYTKKTTRSDEVLSEQSKNTHLNLDSLNKMVDLSHELKRILESGDITSFGEILHKNS